MRRNIQSYPITMQKTVLTSSAMWVFDVIENVMSVTVPEEEKKKRIPKLSKAHKAKVTVTFLKEQNRKHPVSDPSPL